MVKRNFGFTFGRTAEGNERDFADLEKRLAEQGKPIVTPTPDVQPETNVRKAPVTKQGMIYVPSLDLYVSESRILQSKDWNQQTTELHSQNRRMPTIPEFVSFVNYLRSPDGKKAVPNFQAILDEIYKVGGNWRAEYLDASFTKKKKEMYVAYHRFDTTGKIVKVEEKLEDYHSKDETPGIDLSNWLSNSTRQGLPKPNVSQGRLYYWAPIEGRVAGFIAGSGRAGLDCGRDPAGSFASLGVRFVVPKK